MGNEKESIATIQGTGYMKVERIWPIIGFLIITVFVYRKAVFLNLVSIEGAGDAYMCIYSWSHYFIWAIKQGTFPLWVSLNLCGHPFGTEAPSNFNILNLLNMFFHPNLAWNIRSMLCMFLAGYCMSLYARSLKITVYGSFICGLVFMFTDNVVGGHLHIISFMFPLVLLVLDKAIIRRSYRWISLASILMTIFYLNSNPHFIVYISVFCCIYVIFRYYSLEERYSIKDFLLIFGIFILLTLGLSSLQILRTLEVSSDCLRVVLQSCYYMLTPTHFITAIFPYFYESPFRSVENNFFFGRIWQELVKRMPHLFGTPYLTPIYYLGIIPLILGVIAFLKRRSRSVEQFFGWSVIVILAYMSTTFLSHIVIRHLPVLSQLFQTQRTFIICELSMSILAGCGMDLLICKDKAFWQTGIRGINKIMFFIVIIIWSLLGSTHLLLVWNKEFLLKIANGLVEKYIIGNPLYIAPSQLYHLRIEQLYEQLHSWTNVLGPSLCISTIIIISSVLLLYLYVFNIVRKNVFKIMVISVILVDFFIFKSHIPFYTNEEVLPKVSTIDYLNKQPGVFRVMPLQDIRDLTKPMKDKIFLGPNTNLLYGISTPEGAYSLTMKRYADLMMILQKGTNYKFTGVIRQFEDIHQHIANLINIKYVVTSKDRVLKSPFRHVYIDNEYRVYENTEVFPRAFAVHKSLMINKGEDVLNAIRDNDVPLDKVVILENDSDGNLKLPASNEILYSNVRIEEYKPHSVVVNADMKADGYLVMSDCYFPGWRVYVDGERDKIYRADYIFRAVALTKGEHKLRFVYKPFSVKLGLIFIFLSLSLVVCIFIKTRRRR